MCSLCVIYVCLGPHVLLLMSEEGKCVFEGVGKIVRNSPQHLEMFFQASTKFEFML